MRPTPHLLARGFLGRSVEEFMRRSRIAITFEALSGPTGPFPLITLDTADATQDCKPFSDADTGGFSTVHLDFVPAAGPEPAHARFHGRISTELPRDRPEIQRTGYAAWRTRDRGPTLFGRSLWDIDPYLYLAMRIKSDGRKYLVNVQTESVIATDIHQHRLYARRPTEWETVVIQWHDFVRTNHGTVVEPQGEMLRQRVRTVGIGLTDRIPGPFDLRIQRMWATNALSPEDLREDGRVEPTADERPHAAASVSSSLYDDLRESRRRGSGPARKTTESSSAKRPTSSP
ncbi:MAG: hypothetical protein M1826_001131 [Phylliscum demangeonii]|nr:MAG: hypothetical protein M1826_001131 [Phylliscum demangeonii]